MRCREPCRPRLSNAGRSPWRERRTALARIPVLPVLPPVLSRQRALPNGGRDVPDVPVRRGGRAAIGPWPATLRKEPGRPAGDLPGEVDDLPARLAPADRHVIVVLERPLGMARLHPLTTHGTPPPSAAVATANGRGRLEVIVCLGLDGSDHGADQIDGQHQQGADPERRQDPPPGPVDLAEKLERDEHDRQQPGEPEAAAAPAGAVTQCPCS